MLLRAAQTTVVRSASARAALTLVCLLVSGCASPSLEYEDRSLQARIDNPDWDGVWDQADQNGNSMTDQNEPYRPTIEFRPLHETATTTTSRVPASLPSVRQPFFVESDFGNDSFSPVTPDVRTTKDQVHMRGVQLSRSILFSSRDDEGDVEHNLELVAGARIFQLQDQFTFVATNGVSAPGAIQMTVDNMCLGPQIGAKWNAHKQNWNWAASGALLAGQLDADGAQVSQFGNGSDPNDVSQSPHYRSYSNGNRPLSNFSPLGEFDLSTSYQATSHLALRLGYSVFYAGNLQYAVDSLSFVPGSSATFDAPGRDTFQKTVYANIELLR